MDAATFPGDPPTLIRPHLSQPFCTTRPVATPLFLCFLAHSAYRARVLGINSTRALGHNDASHIRGSGSMVSALKLEDDVSRLILDAHIQQLLFSAHWPCYTQLPSGLFLLPRQGLEALMIASTKDDTLSDCMAAHQPHAGLPRYYRTVATSRTRLPRPRTFSISVVLCSSTHQSSFTKAGTPERSNRGKDSARGARWPTI